MPGRSSARCPAAGPGCRAAPRRAVLHAPPAACRPAPGPLRWIGGLSTAPLAWLGSRARPPSPPLRAARSRRCRGCRPPPAWPPASAWRASSSRALRCAAAGAAHREHALGARLRRRAAGHRLLSPVASCPAPAPAPAAPAAVGSCTELRARLRPADARPRFHPRLHALVAHQGGRPCRCPARAATSHMLPEHAPAELPGGSAQAQSLCKSAARPRTACLTPPPSRHRPQSAAPEALAEKDMLIHELRETNEVRERGLAWRRMAGLLLRAAAAAAPLFVITAAGASRHPTAAAVQHGSGSAPPSTSSPPGCDCPARRARLDAPSRQPAPLCCRSWRPRCASWSSWSSSRTQRLPHWRPSCRRRASCKDIAAALPHGMWLPRCSSGLLRCSTEAGRSARPSEGGDKAKGVDWWEVWAGRWAAGWCLCV